MTGRARIIRSSPTSAIASTPSSKTGSGRTRRWDCGTCPPKPGQ
jgi:hypothetical protein